MHLYKPEGSFFVGDCMPFYHEDVFHLYYLLDENHHQGKGGLGGHQWAHVSSRDLVEWQHHPLALPISEDWEASICTGSVFWYAGVFHAFYATRKPDWTQHLSHATSTDGITFTKISPNPFLSPPKGFGIFDFRDPFVFCDESGLFQMLVTAKLDPYPLFDRGGCLLRLSSSDLYNWNVEDPFFVPGGMPGYRSVPECSDYFYWNGWYYLLFSLGLRTYYRMAKAPFGPWQKPVIDLLDSPLSSVMKTCPIWNKRRIGASFLGTREGDLDDGSLLWAGNVVFRELIQHEDGTLSTGFVPEMQINSRREARLKKEALSEGVIIEEGHVFLSANQTQEVVAYYPIPSDFKMRCRVTPLSTSMRLGFGLRGSGRYERQVDLVFEPGLRKVSLANQVIEGVGDICQPFELSVLFREDIVEACINQSRCIINRLPELQGDRLFLFAEHGSAVFENLHVDVF